MNGSDFLHLSISIALVIIGNAVNFLPGGLQENVSPTVSVVVSASGIIWFILWVLRHEQKDFVDKEEDTAIPPWARYVILIGLIGFFFLMLLFLNVRNIIEYAFNNDTITSWKVCYYFFKDPRYEQGCNLDAAAFVVKLFFGIPVSFLSLGYCAWITIAVKNYPAIYCTSVYFIKTATDIMIWVQSLLDCPFIALTFMFARTWDEDNVEDIKKTYGTTNKANVRSLTYLLTFGLGIVIIPLGIEKMIYPSPVVEWLFIVLIFFVSSMSPMASGAITVYMTVKLLNISNILEGCLVVMFVVHGSSVVQLLATYFFPSFLVPIIDDAIQSDDLFMRNMYGLTGACHDLIESKNTAYIVYNFFKVCHAGYMVSWTGDTMYSVATAALLHEYKQFFFALLVCLIKDLAVMCLPISLYIFSAFPSPATLTVSLLAYIFTSGLSPLVSRIFTETALYVYPDNKLSVTSDTLVARKVISVLEDFHSENSFSTDESLDYELSTIDLDKDKSTKSYISKDMDVELLNNAQEHNEEHKIEDITKDMKTLNEETENNDQRQPMLVEEKPSVSTIWQTKVKWKMKDSGFLTRGFFGVSVIATILPVASLLLLVLGLLVTSLYVKHAKLRPVNPTFDENSEKLAAEIFNKVDVQEFVKERKPVTWKMKIYLLSLFTLGLVFLVILILPEQSRKGKAAKVVYTVSAMIVYILQFFIIRYDFLESAGENKLKNETKQSIC